MPYVTHKLTYMDISLNWCTERHNSINVFYDFQPVIISFFKKLYCFQILNYHQEELLSAIQTLEFNVSLLLSFIKYFNTQNIFVYIMYIYKKNIDLFQALNHIDIIISEIQSIGNNCEVGF